MHACTYRVRLLVLVYIHGDGALIVVGGGLQEVLLPRRGLGRQAPTYIHVGRLLY